MRRLLPLLALPLLAGCLGGPVVGPTTLDRYTSFDGSRFVGNGQLVLVGTAFGAATPEVAALAAAKIAEGAMSRAEFRLKPKGPEDAEANNRVVVVIGGGNGAGLCGGTPPVGGRFEGGDLRVAAAACSGSTRLSSTSGSVSGVTGPDDPRLARLFSQLGSELFPLRNPDLEEQNQRDWKL